MDSQEKEHSMTETFTNKQGEGMITRESKYLKIQLFDNRIDFWKDAKVLDANHTYVCTPEPKNMEFQ